MTADQCWFDCPWWPIATRAASPPLPVPPSPSTSTMGCGGGAPTASDVLPSLLDFVARDDLATLASVCHGARASLIRAAFLRQSLLQIDASAEGRARGLLAFGGVAQRQCLKLVSITAWHAPPPPDADREHLRELLRDVRRVRFDGSFDIEDIHHRQLQERQQLRRRQQERQPSRQTGADDDDGTSRRVRPRIAPRDPDDDAAWDPDQPLAVFVQRWLAPWLEILPRELTELDLRDAPLIEWSWLERFPMLRVLEAPDVEEGEPPSAWAPLGTLSGLECLLIGGISTQAAEQCLAPLTRLRDLEIHSDALTSLAFARNLPSLRRLAFSGVVEAVDLGPCFDLGGLEELLLSPSLDVLPFRPPPEAPVPGLAALRRLELSTVDVPLHALVPHVPRLQVLHLQNCVIDSFEPLNALSELEEIAVAHEDLGNWTSLRSLPKLRQLSLEQWSGVAIASDQFTGPGWKALEVLSTTAWDDYRPLATWAPRLKHLELADWRERHADALGVLQEAQGLRTLEITFVEGHTEVSALRDLTKLTHLRLVDAAIVSIEFLRGLAGLEELQLRARLDLDASIVDFSPLRALPRLRRLDVSGRVEFTAAHMALLDQLPSLREAEVGSTSAARTLNTVDHQRGHYWLACGVVDADNPMAVEDDGLGS